MFKKLICPILLCFVLLFSSLPVSAAEETEPAISLSVPAGDFFSLEVTADLSGDPKAAVAADFDLTQFSFASFEAAQGIPSVCEQTETGVVISLSDAVEQTGEASLGRLTLRSIGSNGTYPIDLTVTKEEQQTALRGYAVTVFSYGMVDDNEEVDPVDAMLVLQNYTGSVTLERWQSLGADIDANETVDPSDALAVLQLGVNLPVEGPAKQTSSAFALGEGTPLQLGSTRMFRSVVWSNSNPDAVSVSATGQVDVLKSGTAVLSTTVLGWEYVCTVVAAKMEPPVLEPAFRKGMDVYNGNGAIDWQTAKENGIEFAMIRAGYGKDAGQMDRRFLENYENAKAAGVPIGVYHYSYATSPENATKEAEYLLSILDGRSFEYPVAYDLEDPSMASLGKETLTQIAKNFTDKIREAGYYPIIYANLNWLRNYLDMSQLPGVDVWLAQWGVEEPTYQGTYTMWQYTSDGSVPGVPSARVDLNYCYVDYPKYLKELGLNHLS